MVHIKVRIQEIPWKENIIGSQYGVGENTSFQPTLGNNQSNTPTFLAQVFEGNGINSFEKIYILKPFLEV